MRARLLANDIRGWCDAFTAMANVDTAPKLKSLQMPVLCLAGGDDRSTPPPVVKAMADAIPGARYAELPNGPHMMFFEMPEETAEIVGPFFRETLRGRSYFPLNSGLRFSMKARCASFASSVFDSATVTVCSKR